LNYSYQKDSISQQITHIDFLKIDDKTPVTVRVPVVLSGIPVGVKNQGGLFSQENRYLKLSVVPSKIPTNLSMDVSDFNAGTTFYAKDFNIGEASLISPPRTVIFTISTKAKAAKEEAAAAAVVAAAAAPAASAAAAPAAGAAATAPAASAPAAKK
jgi:large subunit ribosomal protein L25